MAETTQIRVGLKLEMKTPLSIGAGGSSGGFADKTIVRDGQARLIMPGSHLKGRLRHACEAIARAAGYAVCGGPRAEQICPQAALAKGEGMVAATLLIGEASYPGDYYCIVCQLFGAPGYPAPLRFNDLRLEEPDLNELEAKTEDDKNENKKEQIQARLGLHGLTEIRPGVSINRMRGVAEEHRLFFIETTRPGLSPTFQNGLAIEGNLPLFDNGPTEEVYQQLLKASLKYNQQWGGGKTRGLGWAEAKADFDPASVSIPPQVRRTKAEFTELFLTLKALSPLCLSERKPGEQFRRSQPFIPGRVLRGALAQHLKRNGELEFLEQLFGTPEGQLLNHFGHAQPAYKVEPNYLAGFAAPLTARACKNFAKEHGSFDSLLDLLDYEERLKKQNGPLLPDKQACPNCKERTEALGGLLTLNKTEYKSLSAPEGRLLTRVAINRKRAAAEDNLLYSPLVLNEGNIFQARLKLEDAVSAAKLFEFLEATPAFQLGGGTSRGLGTVQIIGLEALVSDQSEKEAQIQARVKAFNANLEERELDTKNKLYFSLNARSELAFGGEVAPPSWEFGGQAAELIRCVLATTQRSGWHSLWGLPLDNQTYVASGSLYVFSVARSGLNETEFYKALAGLEREGLGEGQAEGYGAVQVCEAFHYEKTYQKVVQELQK